jgi:PAS domain S-box-containing protein
MKCSKARQDQSVKAKPKPFFDQARLEAALDAAQVGVWDFDPRTRQVIWNEQHERLLGYEPGRPHRSVEDFYSRLYADDIDRVRYEVELAIREDNVFIQEFRVVWPNGSIHWMQSKGNVIRDCEGNVTRLAGVILDITERKEVDLELQRSRCLLKSIIDNTPAVVFMKDSNGNFILTNKTWKGLHGLSQEPGVLTDYDLHSKEVADTVRANDREVVATGRAIQREETIFIEGRPRTYVVVKFPIFARGKTVPLVCGIATEITEQKKTLCELQRLSLELARSNDELDKFAAITSHDLKEPIRVIITYLQLVIREWDGKIDPKTQQRMDIAMGGARRMATLVDALLKYARAGSRNVQIEKFSCGELVREVLGNLSTAIEESRAEIMAGDLPSLSADRLQIGQVFQNLVSNAIKFRRLDEGVKIQVSCIEKTDEWVFSIRDNGIGIAAQHLSGLFIIFHRLNPRDRYSGEGIGLAACKKIVERHKGNIWVESEFGVGTTFFFTVPKNLTPS